MTIDRTLGMRRLSLKFSQLRAALAAPFQDTSASEGECFKQGHHLAWALPILECKGNVHERDP